MFLHWCMAFVSCVMHAHLGCYTSSLQSDSQAENSPSLGRKPPVFPKRHPGWQTDSKMSESTDSGLDRMQMLPSAEPFELVFTARRSSYLTAHTCMKLVNYCCLWLHQFHATFWIIWRFCYPDILLWHFFLEIRTTFRCYEKKLDFLIVYMYSCNNNRYQILSWCPISLYAGQESWSSIFTPSSRIKTSQITSHYKTYAFTKQPPSYAGQWWRIFWLIRGRTTQGSSTEEGPHASSYTLSWYPWT